jgi:hypothetical protein
MRYDLQSVIDDDDDTPDDEEGGGGSGGNESATGNGGPNGITAVQQGLGLPMGPGGDA